MDRTSAIAYAASLPKGDTLRRDILSSLKEGRAENDTWNATLVEAQVHYLAQVNTAVVELLKNEWGGVGRYSPTGSSGTVMIDDQETPFEVSFRWAPGKFSEVEAAVKLNGQRLPAVQRNVLRDNPQSAAYELVTMAVPDLA